MIQDKIFCSACGEELRSTDKFCSSCGAIVVKNNNSRDKENSDLKRNSGGTKNKSLKKQKDIDSKIPKDSNSRTISKTKIIYLLIALIGLIIVINYSAGVFEKPTESSAQPSSNLTDKNDVQNGADLLHIQQINSLEEKVKNNPADKIALLELAHLLNDSGFKERAIEKYKIYLNMDSANADVLVDMGVCYYELRKYDDAILRMKEALKFQPKHQIAHLNLGIVNMTAGNHDEAVAWLKKAVEIDSNTDIAKRAQELINSH